MSLKYKVKFSVDDYLRTEIESLVKREFINGEVFAMAGASTNHNRLVSNTNGELRTALKGTPCEPFSSDMKVRVRDNFYYPDVIVDCDHITNDNGITDSPIIIIEILSKSTRRTDQVLKRTEYQQLDSLMEYIVIEQGFVDIEICSRNNGWKSEHKYLGDELYFESIDISIPVIDIYDRVANEDVIKYIEIIKEESEGYQT